MQLQQTPFTIHTNKNIFKRLFLMWSVVCQVSATKSGGRKKDEKKKEYRTNPFDWIVKQRLVKLILSCYGLGGFSTYSPVMNFKGTFKSTIHPAYQAHTSCVWLRLGEGSLFEESSWGGGGVGWICSDTYGSLAG